ncbi:uncharacterized protein [Phyllobates terribilis]|uniref:uncharacterized protein n=1 Tax=Phyllobates terribilis TaxID=111132 RepID=UPI003CCAFD8A
MLYEPHNANCMNAAKLVIRLYLSNNKFSSFPPIQHEASNLSSWQIDLSNNRISGSLPGWIFHIIGLRILNLAYNMFSGAIPSNIGSLRNLNALHLNNNRLSGNLPPSFKSCTELVILELGNNNFSGSVPLWLGDSMLSLIVLDLRSNNVTGNLPTNLCQLQRLQVLDLSSNKISGSIPRCVHNFTSMATYDTLSIYDGPSSFFLSYGPTEFIDYATIMWKGILANESGGNLPQLNVIDLSDNFLVGDIPSGFTSLKYLRSLDLSKNKLNGSIPYEIGQLKILQVLKLSSNTLGGIPQSLSDLTFLNTLNLSSNNLAGRIPTSTQLQSFDRSSYGGNSKLCGDPLPTICPMDILQQPATILVDHDHTGEKDDETFDMQAFYAALGSGFAFGFLGILAILTVHARSRHAFFHFASEFGDWIYVRIFLFCKEISSLVAGAFDIIELDCPDCRTQFVNVLNNGVDLPWDFPLCQTFHQMKKARGRLVLEFLKFCKEVKKSPESEREKEKPVLLSNQENKSFVKEQLKKI